MTCCDAELLLATHAVDGLDEADEDGLRLHLQGCAGCREHGGIMVHVGAMLAETVVPVSPPPRLRAALMAQVRAEAAAPAPAATSAPTPPWWRRLWGRVPTGRPFTIGGGVAAAAAGLLAAWSFALPHPGGALAVDLRSCGSASVSATGCDLTSTPGQDEAALTIARLAGPTATGGSGAQTYEVWLIPRSGAPVPAAFLARQPGGGEWSAAISGGLHDVRAIAVTTEPAGGSPAPTGPEVLRVPLPSG